ncbi:16S rRNA (guanine(527)-N(7))-methyltransferase RsmG [Mycoplasmopsis edwardii]|uniref:16S rRNA (Guanine(527)-N(7))-methyltransferase RsmG n=1 Tax=Mycoplasmopsis edwardii TaxID=53558 RepID=A0ACD4PGP2_9BACT|nr:16S rRNA (guanine(527)-N(7))-methyltransferase RsmG [Mycoplasmopsis edwardii]WBP83807.1 16S rRNA (guanine(527)-N(7))-methyltransferase RsmG [Mycoplasmopsis edwardii]
MSKKDEIQQLCVLNKWDFTLFEKYVNLIEEKNKVMNLTGFTGETLWEEGIWESLIFMLKITENQEGINILDVGAGAGFPSIPYVLTKPKNKVTIYESLLKRVNFLKEVIETLNLSDYVTVYRQRVEEVKEKNLFEIVTARAVASVKGLMMSSFHLVKINGSLIMLKSKKYQDEINEAENILKLTRNSIEVLDLDNDYKRDNKIVKITKLRSTPSQFPFSWKDIKKQQ